MGKILKNLWWTGGAKVVSKNILKRITWSIFNSLRTSKEHTVYLSAAAGILLILLGQWLTSFSITQRDKLVAPLQQIDNSIDEVIAGLNFLTQTLPVDIEVWLNTTLFQTQAEMQNLLQNAGSALVKPLNHITSAISSAINELIVWERMQTGQTGNSPTVVFPVLVIPIPSITGWAPVLPPLDLNAAAIPRRMFSVEAELSPFIYQMLSIPLTVAYYIIMVGAILLAYATFRILFAISLPWIPQLNWNLFNNISKCLKLTRQAFRDMAFEFLKPWIHIPFIIGVVMTIVVSLWLFAAIQNVDGQIRQPLRQADMAIDNVVNQINTFTLSIPVQIKSFSDKIENDIDIFAYNQINFALVNIKSVLATIFGELSNAVNSVFMVLDPNNLIPINIASYIDEATVGPLITIPTNFLPPIPLLDVTPLLLPANISKIEATIVPWVDDRMHDFYDVAEVLLIISIILVILPGSALAGAFIKPFIPRPVMEYFLHPDYKDQEMNSNGIEFSSHAKSHAMESAPKSSLATSHRSHEPEGDFVISEPTLKEV